MTTDDDFDETASWASQVEKAEPSEVTERLYSVVLSKIPIAIILLLPHQVVGHVTIHEHDLPKSRN